LLPPAWFAGLDDALAGSGIEQSWILSVLAVMVTLGVVWVAVSKLAHDYTVGLQRLGETPDTSPQRASARRWMRTLVNSPPLSWWVRDPVERVVFTLSLAYLLRDRDVKLRVYPAVAPLMVIPLMMLLPDLNSAGGGVTVVLAGTYVATLPMASLVLLEYSQQWQAADLFRMAPVAGPAPFCHGARRAVLVILGLPAFMVLVVLMCALPGPPSQLLLLLPGLVILPTYSMLPVDDGSLIPFSEPIDGARSSSRGLFMLVTLGISIVIAAVAAVSRYGGWFWDFLLGETVISFGFYLAMRYKLARATWPPLE
jgi:hypothetical protein